ncbi:MAG: YitT family protein [Oscillospiraceae bacterium]
MGKKIYLKKMLVVVVAQLIMAIGGSFLFCSGMGNDPFGVFNEGIANAFGITFGRANFCVSVGIILTCLVFYRKNLSFTTIVTAVVPGLVLDFYISIIKGLSVPTAVVKYVYPFIGCFILGSFVACYLSMNMGASTMDNLVLWVAQLTKGDYRRGFFICSVIFLVIGIPLGGVWGYATVVTFFGTGNVVKFTTPFFVRTVGKWAEQ